MKRTEFVQIINATLRVWFEYDKQIQITRSSETDNNQLRKLRVNQVNKSESQNRKEIWDGYLWFCNSGTRYVLWINNYFLSRVPRLPLANRGAMSTCLLHHTAWLSNSSRGRGHGHTGFSMFRVHRHHTAWCGSSSCGGKACALINSSTALRENVYRKDATNLNTLKY